MPVPVLPDILKNANWQKEKGKLAKLFGRETGIGAQMDKLKAALDKLDIKKLNVAMAYKNIGELDKAIQDCKSELAKTEPARKEAYALRDLAIKVAGEFKKNKMIPSSSTEHVEKIAKAADAYGLSIRSYDPTQEFEAARQKVLNNEELIKKILRDGMAKCENALKTVNSVKPLVWSDGAWQTFRAYAASVAKAPGLATLHAEWKTLSSLGPDKVPNETAVTKHLKDLTQLLNKTKQFVA